MNLKVKKLSSLEKVFLHEEPLAACSLVDSVLRGEKYSYQIAYYIDPEEAEVAQYLHVKAVPSPGINVKMSRVGVVPSEMPAYPKTDADYLTKHPGLFPDPLLELTDDNIKVLPGQWRSIWVEAEFAEDAVVQDAAIIIRFLHEDGTKLAEVSHTISLIDAVLPKQTLIHTGWFHYDCLSTHYGVEELSESHWTLIEDYMRTAAEHGMNMILTPLFTPPLDTKIGGERPAVQLVKVHVDAEGNYLFDFQRLKRFIDMALRTGMEYFEMSHLFTQWGAVSAPKIIASIAGEERAIFGWDTDAGGDAYRKFLSSLLPQLTSVLEEWGIQERCYFHISDEPNLEQLDSYRRACEIMEPHLRGYKVIDALSDYEFYEKGLIQTPIPANDHIDAFIEAKVPNLWTYYCCAQHNKVSNRFMSMPSRRNRIIATQLYKFDIAGFLHWGYNFWYTQFSIHAINPYAVTDAGCGFPSGDAFLVYPGAEGSPVTSIRLKVFREALYDLRAMNLLESLSSKEFVMSIIEEAAVEPITFSEYPRKEQYIIDMRNRINREIQERLVTATSIM
ncbi:DUF4091 domain-containing protein [Paenibacillus sp. GM2]|uniref:DUF4091 domain-containing protein n=1 Tax=Paenibacillus sp. GM2 TaxID=1622070 RepID=UPI000837D314|nr:DUF4091 domain-containing protein [Paenibacillus sp. GM2]